MRDLMAFLRSQLGRVAGVLLVATGVIVLLVGYHGVSSSAYVAQQLTYVVSGGIAGLFLLGIGATLLISSDLHDDWRKLSHVEEAIDRLAQTPSTDSASGASDLSQPASAIETANRTTDGEASRTPHVSPSGLGSSHRS